jgi:hypothetical protein
VGHLGSGSYLFTSLYSGDANFQPTTGSGSAFAVVVNGTPVSLTLNTNSVPYGSTFTATVDVTGAAGLGRPTGTVTIFSSTGFTLGTVPLANLGTNDTGGTATFNATFPSINVGGYDFYAVYTPTNGNYQLGSSSFAHLTVTAEPTTLAVNCTGGFFGDTCTATVTASVTHTPVPAGYTVNFVLSGSGTGTGSGTTNAAGQANYSFAAVFGTFTVTATFPAQGNYLNSTNSGSVFCFIICGTDRTSPATEFNSLTLFQKTSQVAPFRLF